LARADAAAAERMQGVTVVHEVAHAPDVHTPYGAQLREPCGFPLATVSLVPGRSKKAGYARARYYRAARSDCAKYIANR
jgi:hypothetical protein